MRLTLTCARTCTIALSCTRSIACSPSPSPSQPDRLTPPSRLYPRSSHAGSFGGRRKSCVIDVDEAMCYDRCGYDQYSYNVHGYDRWSLRGTSSQAPCPGLGPAEERARAPSPATLVAASSVDAWTIMCPGSRSGSNRAGLGLGPIPQIQH